MIKTLALIKRRPDLSRSAFRDHYESVHAPLALPLMQGLERYVRHHVEAELYGEIVFDVLTAFWYRDAEAATAMMERFDSKRVPAPLRREAGRALREDELRFMDKPANTFFAVSERRLGEGSEGETSVFVLVAKPEDMTRFDCSRRLVRDHLPALVEAIEAPAFALLRDAFPVGGGPLAWNAVLQLGTAELPGLESWAKAREAEGYRVAAVRTRRFETALGREA